MSRIGNIFRKLRYTLITHPHKKRRGDNVHPIQRWVALVVIFGALVFVTAPSFYFDYYESTSGKPISETIKAPFSLEVEDPEATEQLRKRAEDTYLHYYEYDSRIRDHVIKTVTSILEQFQRLSTDSDKKMEELVQEAQSLLAKDYGINIDAQHVKTLLLLSRNDQTRANLISIFDTLFQDRGVVSDKYAFQSYERRDILEIQIPAFPPQKPLDSETMLAHPEEVNDFLRASLIPRYYSHHLEQEAVFALSASLVQPNIYPLESMTRLARRNALMKIEPVKHKIDKGEIIIERGEIVTPYIQHVIDDINRLAYKFNFLRLFGYAAFVFAAFIFMYLYIRKVSPDFTFSSMSIILLSLPVLIALIIGRLLLIYAPMEQISGYLFPAGAIGMLGVILLNPRIAFAQVIWGALLFGLAIDFNFRYLMVALFGGLTALMSLYTLRERRDVLMAGIKTAAVNLVVIVVMTIVDDPTRLPLSFVGFRRFFLDEAVWGILNGFACVAITFSAIQPLESLFGIVTDVRLLELTGIKHKVLKELEEKAPGTYQHSLNVAKLAESAAQAIGANYLLVRAGAYYHDIGKILKAKYYSENQVTPEETHIHNNISPNMSLLLVRNHVKEGMELAKKYHLPQKIIEFIPQHHGTSLIKYFYQQALKQYNESESNVPVREEDYRYLGPKPQSVEAAIVMLADGVEATATSKLSQPHISEDDIRRIVHETIVEKFNDGQLDECPLTLRDLHNISESFVTTLMSRFHFRVDYPSSVAQKDLGKAMTQKPELSVTKI